VGADALLGFATKLLLPCVMVQSGGDRLQRPVTSASSLVSWRSAAQGLDELDHVSSCGWGLLGEDFHGHDHSSRDEDHEDAGPRDDRGVRGSELRQVRRT
jgi:hypothetical protein